MFGILAIGLEGVSGMQEDNTSGFVWNSANTHLLSRCPFWPHIYYYKNCFRDHKLHGLPSDTE